MTEHEYVDKLTSTWEDVLNLEKAFTKKINEYNKICKEYNELQNTKLTFLPYKVTVGNETYFEVDILKKAKSDG